MRLFFRRRKRQLSHFWMSQFPLCRVSFRGRHPFFTSRSSSHHDGRSTLRARSVWISMCFLFFPSAFHFLEERKKTPLTLPTTTDRQSSFVSSSRREWGTPFVHPSNSWGLFVFFFPPDVKVFCISSQLFAMVPFCACCCTVHLCCPLQSIAKLCNVLQLFMTVPHFCIPHHK